jgi:hypothetical protein
MVKSRLTVIAFSAIPAVAALQLPIAERRKAGFPLSRD